LLTHIAYPLFFKLEIGVAPWIASGLARRPLARLLNRREVYIPNAIDCERFNRTGGNPVQKKALLSIPPEAPLIGTVGRLTKQKGYPYLIEAAATVVQNIRDVRFLIIGQGEDLPFLQNLAQKVGVSHRIDFLGPRQDIEELLPCLDLFVSSSLWEGLPTVLLEAMAARVPVIGTDIPGTSDLIRHGENGWLVPAGDAPSLAAGMVALMQNPTLRRRLVEAAKNVPAAFSMPRIAHHYECHYLQVLLQTHDDGQQTE
jgi:glycosyltransferase involved in cell wall biosynthesis